MVKRSIQGAAFYGLYGTLHELYYFSIGQLSAPQQVMGHNGPSFNTLSAFMLTIAVWESYLNLVFFSPWTKVQFGEDVFNKMSDLMPGLEKMSITEKTFSLPLIAFDKTFRKDARPFQDLKDIVTIRNAVTHNSMYTSPEKAVAAIRSRGLLLLPPKFPPPQTWDQEISTLEVMRWCINTIGHLDKELLTFPSRAGASWRQMFGEITERQAKAAINKRFKT